MLLTRNSSPELKGLDTPDDLETIQTAIDRASNTVKSYRKSIKMLKLQHVLYAHLYNSNKNKVSAKLPTYKLLCGESLEQQEEFSAGITWGVSGDNQMDPGFTPQQVTKHNEEGGYIKLAEVLQEGCNELDNLQSLFC